MYAGLHNNNDNLTLRGDVAGLHNKTYDNIKKK